MLQQLNKTDDDVQNAENNVKYETNNKEQH